MRASTKTDPYIHLPEDCLFSPLLKPLPVGTHEIHWSGVLGSVTSTSAQIEPEDLTYHLKVQLKFL